VEQDRAERRRRRRRRNILVGAGIVVAVLVGYGALVVWDLGRECVRWETRTHFQDYAERPIRFCAEYRPSRGTGK
jgi:hypothetical protein